MDEMKQFSEVCGKNNIEPIMDGNQIVLICPKIPGKILQDVITKMLPADADYRWEENLKVSTVMSLRLLFKNAGGDIGIKMNGSDRSGELMIAGQSPYLEEGSPLWNSTEEILIKDQYLERFKITLNGKVIITWDRKISEEIASHGTGNYISKDDLLNLKIALGASQDVNDFIFQLTPHKG